MLPWIVGLPESRCTYPRAYRPPATLRIPGDPVPVPMFTFFPEYTATPAFSELPGVVTDSVCTCWRTRAVCPLYVTDACNQSDLSPFESCDVPTTTGDRLSYACTVSGGPEGYVAL